MMAPPHPDPLATRLRTVDPLAPDPAAIAEAASALARGELVVFPTETVYGIAARADDPAAVARLRAAKGRDGAKPLTLHVADVAALRRRFPLLPATAERLLRAGVLPGPVTFVLPVPGGTLGVRVPEGAVPRSVLAACPFDVVASSANLAGEPPAVDGTAAAAFGRGRATVVLDAGPCARGVASTVVRLLEDTVEVLREGAVPGGEIRRLAGTVA
jgi:L-threonylcarbamoyladenylate synthase